MHGGIVRYLTARPLVSLAWLAVIGLALLYANIDLRYAFTHPGWRAAPMTLLGRDFVNVFTAGHLVLEHKLAIIYDVDAYRAYQTILFDNAVQASNYSYTPVSFLYVWVFALTGYGLAYLMWIGATAIFFLFAARPYLREAGLPAWLALIMPAAIANVWAGHYGFLFGAVWLAAWRLMDSRPRLAGILVGLMIVKPHLAILMPLVLARRGAWSAFVAAALTAAGVALASALVFGLGPWRIFLHDTLLLQATMLDSTRGFYMRMMPTVFPDLRLAGMADAGAWAVQAVVAAGALAALLKWLPRDPMRAGFATAAATFLVLPYAFNYDMTVVCLAALIMLHDGTSGLSRRLWATLAFLLPLALIFINLAGLPLAPVAMIALLVLLLDPRPRPAPRLSRPQHGAAAPTG